MYYKRDNEILQQASEIYAPGFVLTPDNHATYQYPIDGWYWFDTLNEALSGMISPPDVPTVTALQGMLSIKQAGLTAAFVTWKSGLDPVDDFETIAFFEKAQTWRRDNPYLIQGATALGLTETQLDELFILAATL
jgi:hypothetical protein